MATAVGKIDAFVDCGEEELPTSYRHTVLSPTTNSKRLFTVSPYSYYAILYLLRNRDALLSHGVEVEIHPIFLGGVMKGSGNKPPWLLPAKGKYMDYDEARAKKYFNIPNLQRPKFFPILTLLPQRCLVYIKAHYPRQLYEATFLSLWKCIYELGIDISKPANMAKALSSNPFPSVEIYEILGSARDPEYKEMLSANTRKALDYGAFGAPWFWVRNAKGEEEPFFGSDRFHYMFEFLEVPYQDIAIKEKGKL